MSECDASGSNCRTGFHTGFHSVFYCTLNGGPQVKHGWDGAEREQVTPERFSDFYDTPERAFEHVFEPVALTATETSSLLLYVPDCCFGDNTGGLEIRVLQVEPAVTAVPVPASAALLLLGLIGVGAQGLRRRHRESAPKAEH